MTTVLFVCVCVCVCVFATEVYVVGMTNETHLSPARGGLIAHCLVSVTYVHYSTSFCVPPVRTWYVVE
jgi:hypothetical protein